MKRTLHTLIAVAALTSISGIMFTSCHHKEIVCNDSQVGDVSVKFEWDNAEKAAVEGMTVYFYPTGSNGKIWRFDISGRDGGRVGLPMGNYNMIAVNNDLPGVAFSGLDSFGGFTASARSLSGSGSPMTSTGMLYGTTVHGIEVSECGVSYIAGEQLAECPAGIIRCHPDSLSTIYNIKVETVGVPRFIRSASATLCGLASSLELASASLSSDGCNVRTALNSVDDNRVFLGSLSGFAICPSVSNVNLVMRITREDGKSFEKSIDVTDQIRNCLNPRNVYIHIKDLEIPDESPDEGDNVGVIVDVDGWTQIDIYL